MNMTQIGIACVVLPYLHHFVCYDIICGWDSLQKAEGKRDDDATSRSQKSQVQYFTIQRISASTCDSYWTKSMPVGF
jgi:hypothetical protein